MKTPHENILILKLLLQLTVIGALAEINYKDIVSNGSVGTDGTGAYSVSHFNGFNIDFKYLT